MKTYTLYTVEHFGKNCCEPMRYGFDFDEIVKEALATYQQMCKSDQDDTDVWVCGYECSEEETDLSDSEKTYKKIIESDQEVLGWLREYIYAGKLNSLNVKYFGCGSYTISDAFNHSCDISTSDYLSAYYDDEHEAFDALVDYLSEKLVFDKDTIKNGSELSLLYDDIRNDFDCD